MAIMYTIQQNINDFFPEFKAKCLAVDTVNMQFVDDDHCPQAFNEFVAVLRTCDGLEALLVHFSLAEICFHFAEFVVGGRWEVCEFVMLGSAKWASNYAIYIIKGPWLAAESIINTDSESADNYYAFLKSLQKPA